ncbi:MAG: hypothetical protein VB034_01035 [Eubacteriales bacterium]|nr:hypothetical protein [Eubacteriales bacterium]
MKRQIKRGIALLICALLALGAFGCGTTPSGSVDAAKTGAKGRYVEREIKLPMPEGFSEQYVIGICYTENGLEVFTNTYSTVGEETTTWHFRHTISSDGSVKTTDETWLNDLAPRGGNEMRVQRADDGALYLSQTGFSDTYDLVPEILVSHDDGKTGESLTGDGIALLTQANSFGVLANGDIAATEYFNGGYYLLDSKGNLKEKLEGEAKATGPAVAAQGTKIALITKGAQSVKVTDTADGSSVEYPYAFAEQTYPHLAYAPDGMLYLCDATGIYRHSPDGTLWERIVDGSATTIGLPSYILSCLYACGGENGDIYVNGPDDDILQYTYDPAAEAVPSQKITVFSLKENETVQQAVVAFNRMRSDVAVEYTVAMKQDAGATAQDYIKALNTELLAGKGPDVLILDGLPVDSYIEKGVLADIGSVLDGAEEILPNVKAASLAGDGKLYAIPTGVQIPLAFAPGAPAGAFDSLSALASACEASADLPLLPSAAFSNQTLAEVLLRYYGSTLRQGNAQDIPNFLTDAGRIAKAIGATDELGGSWDAVKDYSQEDLLGFMRQQNAGPQIWADMTGHAKGALLLPIGSVYDGMIEFTACEKLNATLYGVGGQYQPTGLVGINRAGTLQDAAGQFVQVMLSYDVQSANRYAEAFPVNAKAFSELIAAVDNTISQAMHLDGGDALEAEWPSDAMRAKLGEILTSANTPLATDTTLSDMLAPAVVAYLQGDDTLETAAGKMESVISTYLSE